jgi:hypothetical protein
MRRTRRLPSRSPQGGTSHNSHTPPPTVLECPKCGQRVIVHIPAEATCLPCGRRMRRVERSPDAG